MICTARRCSLLIVLGLYMLKLTYNLKKKEKKTDDDVPAKNMLHPYLPFEATVLQQPLAFLYPQGGRCEEIWPYSTSSSWTVLSRGAVNLCFLLNKKGSCFLHTVFTVSQTGQVIDVLYKLITIGREWNKPPRWWISPACHKVFLSCHIRKIPQHSLLFLSLSLDGPERSFDTARKVNSFRKSLSLHQPAGWLSCLVFLPALCWLYMLTRGDFLLGA